MSPVNRKLSIAIVDDHPIVMEGMKTLLEKQYCFHVAGCFTTGYAFLSFLASNPVDVVLLDITLPDGSGIDFCAIIKKTNPEIIVLALSNLSERSTIRLMLQSGANGYLLKNASAEELLSCINNAFDGQIVFSTEAKEIMDRPELDMLTIIPELTKRERQILIMLAAGSSSAVIAENLFISPLTVKTHRATLLQKFEVNNVVAMINRAREYRLT